MIKRVARESENWLSSVSFSTFRAAFEWTEMETIVLII